MVFVNNIRGLIRPNNYKKISDHPKVILQVNNSNLDSTEIEAIRFFKTWDDGKHKDQIFTAELTFWNHIVNFNDKANRELRVLLNSEFTFFTNIKEKLNKAKVVETKIKKLTRIYKLFIELVKSM